MQSNRNCLNATHEQNVHHQWLFKIFETKIRKKAFDIFFLDPPYKEKKIYKLISLICENNILSKNGIIILHRHKKEKDCFPKKFNILVEKKYGLSKIIFGNFN